MHIGVDGRFLQGQNTGVTNYLRNLLLGLSRIDGVNNYTVFLSDPAYASRVPYARNFHLEINNANSIFWKNFWLPSRIKKLKIDLMHFPAYTASFANVGKNVVTVPDVIHKVNPGWFSRKERLLLNVPIYVSVKKADHIIAISECTKEDIVKYFGLKPEKISVTLLAADSSFRPIEDRSMIVNVKKKYNINNDFILNVGVLFKRRNIERLLEAFSLLKKDTGIEDKLVIVGPGKSYFDLGYYIRKNALDSEVIYLGYVEQDDMPLLYNAAKFFIYPSLYEGFGLPVLEAMSCRRAVITSNASSLPEVAGESGLLVNPSNPKEIYLAMKKLTENVKLRDDLAEKGFLRAKSFSWEKMAEQTKTIYQELTGSED